MAKGEGEHMPTSWQRVQLGEGIELHYVATADARFNEMVMRLIDTARRVLDEGRRAGAELQAPAVDPVAPRQRDGRGRAGRDRVDLHRSVRCHQQERDRAVRADLQHANATERQRARE